MPLVSHSIPALTGGISQQAATLRFKSQADDLENAFPSLVEGLQKRPPSESFGWLAQSGQNKWLSTDQIASHFIDRDSNERYLVSVNPHANRAGDYHLLRVHDLSNPGASWGAIPEKLVRVSRSAFDYLGHGTPEPSDYSFQTIGDVTFIANRKKLPAMRARKTDKGAQGALVYIRGASSSNADLVLTFNGTSTAATNGATTKELTGNLHSAITGTNGAATAVIVNPPTNNITYTGSLFNDGEAVRFDVGSGTLPKYRYYTRIPNPNYNPSQPAGGANPRTIGRWVEATIDTDIDYFVVNAETNKFQLATTPGGAAFDFYTAGASVQIYRMGTTTVPTGFEKCVVKFIGTGEAAAASAGASTVDGNILHISHVDGEDFTLTVTDGQGDSLADVYKGTTDSFTELPDQAIDGFVLEVKNDPGQNLDNYYVKFKADDDPGSISTGYWEEISEPDGLYQIDPRTMPHILVREADGNFACCEAGLISAGVTAVDHTNDLLTIQMAPAPSGTSASGGYGTSADIATNGNIEYFQDGDQIHILATDPNIVVESGATTGPFTLYNSFFVKATSIGSVGEGTQQIELYQDYDGSTFTGQITFAASSSMTAGLCVLAKESPFQSYAWGERLAGDIVTNEDPSFIGRAIEDLTYFKNRLGILSGENVILSESGEFFNFFRTTVVTLLDTAPIDIASSHSEIAVLKTATPFGNQLYVAGDRVQLALGTPGNQAFTASTAEFRIASKLATNTAITPVPVGINLYIPFTRGDYSGVLEYMPDPRVDNRYTPYEVTEHVPYLIPGELRGMAALEREGILAVLGTDLTGGFSGTNSLYVFKSYTAGDERIQSAWARYTFHDADIRAIFFYGNDLHIVMRRTSGWHVDTMSFKSGRVDAGATYVTHLDRRLLVEVPAISYNEADDTTAISTGYTSQTTDPMEVITAESSTYPAGVAGGTIGGSASLY